MYVFAIACNHGTSAGEMLSEPGLVRADPKGDAMREVLEASAGLDRLAERVYADMASVTLDPEIKRLLLRLSNDEAQQATRWHQLLVECETSSLPAVSIDSSAAIADIQALHETLAAYDRERISSMSTEDMLTMALHLELYLTGPIHRNLASVTGLALADSMRQAYDTHLQYLVETIGEHFAEDSLISLLAQALSRTWDENRGLATYATHDALTGLHNRHALYSQLPQWAAWSARYGNPLAFLLVDIDHFKVINDAFGHSVGDDALMAVARALRDTVRASDLVVRFGGDEFAVVAPQAGEAEYRELCERIAAAIGSLQVRDGQGGYLPLTVSIGGAITTGGSTPADVEQLIVGADQSLYQAKQTGRNQAAAPIVVSAE